MVEGRNYQGIHQRKNGTWYYRIKKIPSKGAKPVYCQYSGFATMDDAYEARQTRLQMLSIGVDAWTGEKISYDKETEFKGLTFGEYFQEFLKNCQSEATIKKYQSLYNAQLTMWSDRVITTITLGDIETFLLRLSLEKKKASYISSYRKMLKAFFKFARHLNFRIDVRIEVFLSNRPYTLKVLSLFSGIGAPEQALEELKKEFGIDYELVNFCELDNNAARAFCLLHDIDMEKRIKDVNSINAKYCEEKLPDFDLLVFGFPCQKISKSGNQEGMIKGGYDYILPEFNDLCCDMGLEGLTESGLLYRALQVVIWKKPKFVIIENVAAFASKTFKHEFNNLLRIVQVNNDSCGYNVYFDTLNSADYGIPQHRNRIFIVLIRRDLNIPYHFPDTVELKVRAEEWFEENVADEYYISPEDYSKLDRESWKPNFKRDIISTITTRWSDTDKEGDIDPYVRQTLVKDKKGIRCLTSEELMKFQGFQPEDAVILRENGYTKEEIGKLVGNSITVPVIKAVIKQLITGLNQQIAGDIVPYQIIQAPMEHSYLPPLFAYMGNKYKLLPYMDYVLPSTTGTFVDLFAGSATISMNLTSFADRIIINDTDSILIGIYKALSTIKPRDAWKMVSNVVYQYQLSAENQEGYIQCRADFNKIPIQDREKYWYWALAVIYHSYNRSTLSYNKKGKVNSSFGHKKCNFRKMKKKFISFAERMYANRTRIEFSNLSFRDFVIPDKCIDEDLFFYVDPPYFITQASYNKFWTMDDEIALYEFLDRWTAQGIRWVLSNVLENKGERNEILAEWLKKNQSRYRILYMNRDYKHCTYNTRKKGRTLELLVMNYIE